MPGRDNVAAAGGPSGAALQRIRELLFATSGIDFREYKPATIQRRATRRMIANHLGSLEEYARLLEQNPVEREALVEDVLILTTGFFRDPDAFEALRLQVVPQILQRRHATDAIRIWSAGCSTGEEAYSVAMLFLEAVAMDAAEASIMVFATDVSETALERARQGRYPSRLASAVSPARRGRFFTKSDDCYRVSKALRDACIFARHDITKDPPYSHLDLILCRNVLIYMEPSLQQKVLLRLHYALQPEGFLMVGSAETLIQRSELFRVHDRRHRIYVKEPGRRAPAWLERNRSRARRP